MYVLRRYVFTTIYVEKILRNDPKNLITYFEDIYVNNYKITLIYTENGTN